MRSVGLLDVLHEYACGALGRAPCIRAPFRPLATHPVAISGLAAVVTLILASGPARLYGASGQLQPVTFADAAVEAGLLFDYSHGGSGQRYMLETTGSGVAVADLDGDGWLDVYFMQGAPTPGFVASRRLHNVLYRNLGGGSFVDASVESRLDDEGYGFGVAVADYDNDGFTDVFITNFGANRLFRNNGDGTFSDVGESARVADTRWGTSAAWADIDNDGDLDLYVANYVDFTWDNHVFCGDARRRLRAYCAPDVYNGVADLLYVNERDGTFVDISESAGVANAAEGKGLGVVFGDFDDDGDPDIYVANDSTRNFLYVNQGDGTFLDDALLAGVGYSEDGRAEAGMGTVWGDYDGDGRLDVVVTNLDLETNSLYRNVGGGAFLDVTSAAGLGEPSVLFVGFGTNWIDFDNDTDLDLFVANGHVIDNVELFKSNTTYLQPNHLFRNEGDGRFVEIHEDLGPGFAPLRASRGSAIGDIDNDGDLDIVVSNNNQAADYLRNDGGNEAGYWLQLRLVGRSANRHGAGARVLITPLVSQRVGTNGGKRAETPLVREIMAGSSFCSSSGPLLGVGLGDAESADVAIRWPDGRTERIGELAANRRYVIRQGQGVMAVRELSAPRSGPREIASR